VQPPQWNSLCLDGQEFIYSSGLCSGHVHFPGHALTIAVRLCGVKSTFSGVWLTGMVADCGNKWDLPTVCC
jgi:hypothetical protein